MQQETFDKMKTNDLYKHSAVPFINKLILNKIPLSAISTNDFLTNYMPRVYVTREYGRQNGGATRKVHIKQFGNKAVDRLTKFYHS